LIYTITTSRAFLLPITATKWAFLPSNSTNRAFLPPKTTKNCDQEALPASQTAHNHTKGLDSHNHDMQSLPAAHKFDK
jgi:hypothetical protein